MLCKAIKAMLKKISHRVPASTTRTEELVDLEKIGPSTTLLAIIS